MNNKIVDPRGSMNSSSGEVRNVYNSYLFPKTLLHKNVKVTQKNKRKTLALVIAINGEYADVQLRGKTFMINSKFEIL